MPHQQKAQQHTQGHNTATQKKTQHHTGTYDNRQRQTMTEKQATQRHSNTQH